MSQIPDNSPTLGAPGLDSETWETVDPILQLGDAE
jgi:hypothetical protein